MSILRGLARFFASIGNVLFFIFLLLIPGKHKETSIVDWFNEKFYPQQYGDKYKKFK